MLYKNKDITGSYASSVESAKNLCSVSRITRKLPATYAVTFSFEGGGLPVNF